MTTRILTPIMEDYLEAIYDLSNDTEMVRVRDIAQRLSVKMPTVTSMLKTLAERDLVFYEKYTAVRLTPEGLRIGSETCKRHAVLLKFLHEVLGVDFNVANEEACKMEHALSAETLVKLIDFVSSHT